MRRIVRIVFIVLVVVIISIAYFIIKDNKRLNIDSTISETFKLEESEYIEFEDFNEMGLYLAKKNGDWSKFHLSKEFREKYNEKDGIFGDMQFDNVEYKPYHDGKYSFEDYSYLVVTQGKKKTAYIFSLIGYSEGYDIEFGNIIELTDENGFDLDAKIIITEDNYGDAFYLLSKGGTDEQSIAVTSNFHKKYPCFLDLFIHYSPLGSNEITFDYGKSSWEEKKAYFMVDSVLECKKREYEVKFSLDDKGYLDDAEVKLINEKAYEKNKKEKAGDAVFYKNSNWEYLKLTENFINRYKNKGTFFDDIEKVYISIPAIISIKCNNNWIGQYKYKDGSKHWFYENYIYDDKGYLDDAYFESIDYNGNSGEEAKEIYLNSIK